MNIKEQIRTRLDISLIVAAVSIAAAAILHGFLAPVWKQVSPQLGESAKPISDLRLWLDIGGPVMIYVILQSMIEHWLWRLPFLAWFFKMPNLNGDWTVSVRSQHDNGETVGTAKIDQSWSSISIYVEMPQSTSKSDVAVVAETGAVFTLLYDYTSKPKPGSPETMQIHDGTCKVVLKDDGSLDGDYYTGRGRGAIGTILMKKKDAHKA